MKKIEKQFRHGDLLLEPVGGIPKEAMKKNTKVLLDGEVTGHAHRLDVDDKKAQVYEKNGVIYIHVEEEAPLVHEEHDTILLPVGDYQMTRQREFDPFEEDIRFVQD